MLKEIKGKKIEELISEREIKDSLKRLVNQIKDEFNNEEILVIGILKGSFIFLADLVRELEDNIKVDFLRVASYYDSTKSTGKIEFLKDIEVDIKGKNVLLVDDIIDTGRTLKYLVEVLKKRKPKKIKTCVLLDKRERREVDFNADFVGFVIPDKFVVGYGLDWGEEGRTFKNIYAVINSETD